LPRVELWLNLRGTNAKELKLIIGGAMKHSIAALCISLIVMTGIVLCQAQSVVASATGAGMLTVGGEKRTFAFTAQKDSNGNTTGNGQVVNKLTGAITHFHIGCLSVAGNVATMSGTTTHLNGEGQFDVWFRVADNGEGANSPPDQITLVLLSDPPGPTCSENLNLQFRDIEAGNIQVH
jgi:hypothetical protein